MWRSCLRNKIERVAAFRDRTRLVVRHRLPVRPVPQQTNPARNTAVRPGRLPLTAQPVRPYTTNGCPRATAYDLTNPYLETASSLTSSSHPLLILTPFHFSPPLPLTLSSSLHLLAFPHSSLHSLSASSLILHLTPHASRSRLHPSSFIRPLSPSSLCHSSLLLHLAPLIISSSIIPSSSFSLSSSVLHPLHARSPVLCCVSRVRHAPRPKGFTNRRRVTTLPLPALLRRAPAVRRTRAWPCG